MIMMCARDDEQGRRTNGDGRDSCPTATQAQNWQEAIDDVEGSIHAGASQTWVDVGQIQGGGAQTDGGKETRCCAQGEKGGCWHETQAGS